MALFNSQENENAFVLSVGRMALAQIRQVEAAEKITKLFAKVGEIADKHMDRLEPIIDYAIGMAISEMEKELGLSKDKDEAETDDSAPVPPPTAPMTGGGFTDR